MYVCVHTDTHTHIYVSICKSLVYKHIGSVCTHTILLNSRLHRICYPRILPPFGTAVTITEACPARAV